MCWNLLCCYVHHLVLTCQTYDQNFVFLLWLLCLNNDRVIWDGWQEDRWWDLSRMQHLPYLSVPWIDLSTQTLLSKQSLATTSSWWRAKSDVGKQHFKLPWNLKYQILYRVIQWKCFLISYFHWNGCLVTELSCELKGLLSGNWNGIEIASISHLSHYCVLSSIFQINYIESNLGMYYVLQS